MSRLSFTSNNVFGFTFVISFAALMAIALPHRGLFFAPAKVTASTLVISAVFIGGIAILSTKPLRRQYRVPLYLWLMFGYACYAWLTTFWAANAELAVQGALIDTAAVSLAAMVPLLTAKWRRIWLSVFALLGPVLYLFAMGVVLGFYTYTNAIQDLVQNGIVVKNGELSSVFQYHNTFAVLALAAALVALLLAASSRRVVRRAWYVLNGALSLVGVVCSYSRLSWLLMVLILLLTFASLFMLRAYLDGVYCSLLTPFVALAASPFAIASMKHASKTDLLLVLAVTVLGAVLVTVLISLLTKIQSSSTRLLTTILSITLLIVGALTLFGRDFSKLSAVSSRLQGISFGSYSMRGRFWLYGTARHIWAHSPIFGTGAGTWDAKFQAYQQFPFWSTMTHSVLMSQLVDFGIVGTLLWVGILVTAGIRVAKGLAERNTNSPLILTAALPAVTILLHAIFDFDMNFATISFLFFLLVSMSAAPMPAKEESSRNQDNSGADLWWLVIPGLVMGLQIFVGASLGMSESKVQQASSAPNDDVKISDLHAAEKYASYAIKPHVLLAGLYFHRYLQSHSADDRNNAWSEAQRTAQHGVWDPSAMQTSAVIAYQLGNIPQAYHWAQRSYRDGKLTFKYASTFMGIALWSGVNEAPHNPSDAAQVFQSIIQAYDQSTGAVTRLGQLGKRAQPNWKLQVEAPMQVYAATAEYALGRYQESMKDIRNLSTLDRDQNTMGLSSMITLLDETQVRHSSIANIPNEMPYKSQALTLDFEALAALHRN